MRAPFFASIVATLLIGCPGPRPGTDAGTDPESDAPESTDAPTATDAPDDGDGAVADDAGDASSTSDASAPGAGLVSISQGTFGTTASHATFAVFGPGTIEELRAGIIGLPCTIDMEVGSCRTFTCSTGGTTTDGAGELRVDVAGTRVATIAAPSPGAGQYVDAGAGSVFAAGDPIHVATTGGLVPAFTADVIAPAAPTIILPTTVARTSDLVLTWTGTGGDTMQVSLTFGGGRGVTCLVPAEDETLTIDASLLSSLAAGSTTTVSASYFATTTITSGRYTIDVSVAQSAAGMATVE